MVNKSIRSVLIVLALFFFVESQVQAAAETLTVQQRLLRLERLLSPDNLHKQAETIRSLRDEIDALRGQIEQQNHALEMIKQRQRSLYQDMDRRINNIELSGSNNATVAPVPPPVSAAAVPVVTTAGNDVEGKTDYSVAFGLLKEGKYQQSIAAFEKFIKDHPQSKYADNAQYWLGEANYVSREYKKALTNFQQLIAQFPDSSKIPGARLKIAYIYYELKNWSAAREALQHVITLYPNTTVAKKAKERLQRIQREGH